VRKRRRLRARRQPTTPIVAPMNATQPSPAGNALRCATASAATTGALRIGFAVCAKRSGAFAL